MRAWFWMGWLGWVSGAVHAACPPINVEEVTPPRTFERLASVYSVTTPGTRQRWVLVVGLDAAVNADGAPHSYEVSGDHGTSYLCDGMCVRTDDGCVVGASCRAASAKLAGLPLEADGLRVSCDPPFEALSSLRFFGFKAAPRSRPGNVDCGNTLLPVRKEGDLRFLIPQTSMSLADGQAVPSDEVPFIVRPGNWNQVMSAELRFGMADVAWVVAPYHGEDMVSSAVVGDEGPRDKFGEASIALHQLLVHGKTIAPPLYAPAPGQRHPQRAQIPLPYTDVCDGDIRAKVAASGPWWYLIAPGSSTEDITQASDPISLVKAADAQLAARTEDFGGLTCLMDRFNQLDLPRNPRARPSENARFGKATGKCP